MTGLIKGSTPLWRIAFFICFLLILGSQIGTLLGQGATFQLTVVDGNGTPITVGFKWLVEVDNTVVAVPGVPTAAPISLNIHKSHFPVVATGRATATPASVSAPTNERFVVSVLPDSGYAMGAAIREPGATTVTVICHEFPIPTAQISVLAFVDQGPINNVFDEGEQGLGGCRVRLDEATGGGPISQDAFGNPLGTRYDAGGNVTHMGDGFIYTLTKEDFNASQGLDIDGNPLPGGADLSRNPYNLKVGEALVKYLPPGKYGVVLIPPRLDDDNNIINWVQTATIEGTPTIDAWVKAAEPQMFIEGFGQGFKHVVFGFVIHPTQEPQQVTFKGQTFERTPWNKDPIEDHPGGPTGTITGFLKENHFAKPPMTQGWHVGRPVPEGWVGLNDALLAREIPAPGGVGEVFTKNGRFIAECNADGSFTIPNVPPGTYQLVWWDTPLDYLFGFQSVVVPAGGGTVNVGDCFVFRWFGTFQGSVFLDADEDGFRDDTETTGLVNVPVNIRYRNGAVYQAQTTDINGEYEFAEVFPFFKWLVVEVGFTNHKATGMTAVTDGGGGITSGGNAIVPPHNGWAMPSYDQLMPQAQVDPPAWRADQPVPPQTPVNNPNTGNNLSRTETGVVLTQAMHLFLNQTNVIDWGKKPYVPGENGGISGIVFYAITRAEDDPRYAAADGWEPGVPGVTVNLYLDDDADGVADDFDGSGTVDAGDVLNSVLTDSWDADPPTGCIQPLPVLHGTVAQPCADAYGTWNQTRPGVFDGGYAFSTVFTDLDGFIVPFGTAGALEMPLPAGNYVVQIIVPDGYKLVKEEDKNVEFGDEYVPSPLVIPCECVGAPHTVPLYLSHQTDEAGIPLPSIPAEELIPAPYTGQTRPSCDMRKVSVTDGQNAAADFFIFTDVPKAARVLGFALNDFTAEHNQMSPNFGEKMGAAWIPVSFRDWAGKEIVRVYTDEYGSYNAALPSTFTANAPSPSGYSPNMITLVLNDPFFADGTPDPFHNPTYVVAPWTFHYLPGSTSYLDTPLIPQAAFSAVGFMMDTNPPSGTPVVASVDGNPNAAGEQGPIFCSSRLSQSATQRRITIRSMGTVQVPNPNYNPNLAPGPGNLFQIPRNYGFGTQRGTVRLGTRTLTVVSWSNLSITAQLPTNATTGTLSVRTSAGVNTEVGVTLHVVNCSTTTIRYVVPGTPDAIQDVIDAANANDIVVVPPGSYREMVIMNKPIRLQGAGAGATIINADPNPLQRLQTWHDRIDQMGGTLLETYLLKKIFWQNEAPAIAVIGRFEYPGGNVMFPNETITNVMNDDGGPTGRTEFTGAANRQAGIDGFTLSGSKVGGGIAVFTAARGLQITNNHITGNTGNDAGGISLGASNVGSDLKNINMKVIGNKIDKNGGNQGAGGIGVFEYSNNYLIDSNLITGNFCRFYGGGIAHWGYIPGMGIIQNNKILFNEVHHLALQHNAGHGGGIFIGGEVLGVEGSGSVTVRNNLIQGNISAAGYGGGIHAFAVNGLDVSANPTNPNLWNQLLVYGNTIVNNVAGLAGGGVVLQDVARSTFYNNVIAHNDSTATAALAFQAGQVNSTPHPAGFVSTLHSTLLADILAAAGSPQTFSNPLMYNNTIWENRSFFNQVTNGVGSLAFWNYWDLNVIGSVAPGDPHLNPGTSALTLRFDPKTGYDYGSTKGVLSRPFLQPYFNTLSIATVLDEAGNNISVLISPLVPTGNYAQSGPR
ncbi:MAG: hypothetical protein EHM23_06875 [Acidobacteria bacterium]|nr:MAG: hypothetical protein EHM23_06875 [Acidobacteriota bacterium]